MGVSLRLAIWGVLIVLAPSGAGASERLIIEPDQNYCDSSGRCSDYNEAVDFVHYQTLHPLQVQLLDHLGERYADWVVQHDDEAATFLSVSRALLLMEVQVTEGSEKAWVPFLTFVQRVKRFGSDRVFVALDPVKFDDWRLKNRGEFRIRKPNGKVEDGRFRFKARTSMGGSLHHGYDIQASTSVKDVPRIQINYRFSDGEADIDLDGLAPWKWGFLPNLNHLTYSNSDVRQWFEKYVKKFGDPGFRVRPR